MQSVTLRRLQAWRTEIRTIAFGLIVSLVASLCVVMPSYAAEGVDDTQITMSPTNQKLSLKPGERYEGSFVILNSGISAFDFSVSSAPYQVKNAAYEPVFTEQNTRTQISRWVQFSQTDYRAEPGARIKVPYTIAVPNDVPDGGQYATLFAETTALEPSGTSVLAKKRVGSILYSHIEGTTKESGDVIFQRPSLLQSGDLKVKSTIVNSGNTDFESTVKVKFADAFGNQKHTTSRPVQVLPETERDVESTWENAPGYGLFQVTQEVTQLGKTTSSTGWMLSISPLATLVILILLVLAIIGIYNVAKRRYSSSKPRK